MSPTNYFGFLRVTAASPVTTVANPSANRQAHLAMLEQLPDSHIVLFPELSLSGYTCGELFAQDVLLDGCLEQLIELCRQTTHYGGVLVLGLPMRISSRLYNVAAVVQRGKLLGLVPKQYLPTYQEFYEARWFVAGDQHMPSAIDLAEWGSVPVGIDLLFQAGQVRMGIEICEDLWMPVPPSSIQSLHGANVLLNLSASNETIGKAAYRTQLVTSQSGRCCAIYAYAGAGPGESSTDLVFGGHCLIAENGSLVGESPRVGRGLISPHQNASVTVDVDLQRIEHDRQSLGTLHAGRARYANCPFRRVHFELPAEQQGLKRHVSGQPFVPRQGAELDDRCREIFEIQCAALIKRVLQLPSNAPLVIGVSGGLDSTLALMVASLSCRQQGWPPSRILGLTMPGFGTSSQTLDNALRLMELLEITAEQVDIRPTCLQLFRDLQHRPFGIDLGKLDWKSLQLALESLPDDRRSDLVFENVQARVRTLLLMSRGFVLGTGDLSESALGWSTYNGDHMSMYNVNCSIPKTLVRFLVRYVAQNRLSGQPLGEDIRKVLMSIADTPISPELLPLSKDKQIQQSTENSIGPYELHDFFLYHLVRTGASPEKILFLAEHAEFSQDYDPTVIKETLGIFLKRFFGNQFKRSCVPDGPKVGSVSLSPRGDWRMPTDASSAEWLQRVVP